VTLLLHTDVGHDPDDAVALSYLLERGYCPDYITISPGFQEQADIVWSILGEYGKREHCQIFIHGTEKTNHEPGKHKIFMCGFSSSERFWNSFCVKDAIVIGPPKGLGDRLRCNRIFFQGGYSQNSVNPLPKFLGVPAVQSFNPSGARDDFKKLLASDSVKEKRYIGKNVCHGFTKADLVKIWSPKNKRVKSFFDKLEPKKAMHDVLACMIYTGEINPIWEQATPVFNELLMSTTPTSDNIYSLIGITNYEV